MPKKIRFESAVHQLFAAADRHRSRLHQESPEKAKYFALWVRDLAVSYPGSTFRVAWTRPVPGSLEIPLSQVHFYVRGDKARNPLSAREAAAASRIEKKGDAVEAENATFFDGQIVRLLAAADITKGERDEPGVFSAAAQTSSLRKEAEAQFHDEWAAGVDVNSICVRRMNEACTAPEMRSICKRLGDLRGKRLLDVGCGLGEASVYFAIQGAEVTACDISPGMLSTARRLAAANGVSLTTKLSASEDFGQSTAEAFDVIYAGNLLHHVDIAQTLDRVLPLMKEDGVFISWDPLAYNPIINVYRWMATNVRTDDEHPLRLADLRLLKKRFQVSETRFFWFTTLAIFVIMAVIQRRNPNKERFWKKVVEEADSWSWMYRPLEGLDRVLLAVFPFLRPLCWNVVFIGRKPLRTERCQHC